MALRLLLILLGLTAFSARADEVDFHDWEQLNQIVIDDNAQVHKVSYLPSNMVPGSSQKTLQQQIFNYNLDQMKKTTGVGHVLDTQWGSKKDQAAPSDGVTYQFKPFETKALVDFSNKWRASYALQTFNNSREFLLGPVKKVYGMTIGYSYLVTSTDARNRVSIRCDW